MKSAHNFPASFRARFRRLFFARNTERLCVLADKLETIYDAIADEAGQNITYNESMNGSIFPSVISVAEGTAEDKQEFDGCRFLAENGFILPRRLRKASDRRITAYIRLHLDTVLDLIEAEAESDYYFRIGEHYNTERYAL